MWRKTIIGLVTFKIMCSVVNASNTGNKDIKSLPYCGNKNGSGTVLVSTLDGKLSAINSSGHLSWEIETGPGPLLVSNIHKLELTNNGEWIRIIPSLTGTLYKFDGNTIDPISISAESLLKSSFRYSDDLVIAGGIEVQTYGVGFHSGKLLYDCSQKKCTHHYKDEMDDVVIVERSTQTIRAVESRTGQERWNFSVGLHNIKLPQMSCIDNKAFNSNISAIVPEGLLLVSARKNNLGEMSWQYKFHSPIVRVWKWDGSSLEEINLFEPKNMPGLVTPEILPSIYIGMHKKQLYIYESLQMQHLLRGQPNVEIPPAESSSITKIPWKPIAASTESTEDDSTAVSVLNNSEYVNGNGYYLYSEQAIEEKNQAHCEKNDSKIIEPVIVEEEVLTSSVLSFVATFGKYCKNLIVMVVTLVTGLTGIGYFVFKFWNKTAEKSREIIIVEKPVEAEISKTERQPSENGTEGFSSRFLEDFKLIQCLGKGGFGIVFQVKHKHDDCDYAIKRITLPNEDKSQARVLREVKALAKLDHKNIIRYFSCWKEQPPLGWEEEHDKNWIEPSISSAPTAKSQKKSISYSIGIDIPLLCCSDGENSASGDSFVVFENDQYMTDDTKTDDSVVFCNETDNGTIVATDALGVSHFQKKIDWRRPGRKHHSRDSTQSSPVLLTREPPMYLYIQMQLCQKESLKEWLNLNQKRVYKDMLDIFSQILDAVEYVHLRKLIHRDLKPSNIFFSLDGLIKVGDFGLVKDIESTFDCDHSRRSVTSSYKGHTKEVGTTLYMSPEQSEGRMYDYKVDIYSLGIILFELLVPFSTAMERIKTLTDLKCLKFPDEFASKYPAEVISNVDIMERFLTYHYLRSFCCYKIC